MFPVGEAEPVTHSFQVPKLEAECDWVAEPTLLTYELPTKYLFWIDWHTEWMGTKNSAPRFTMFDWSLLPLHDVMTNSFLDALKYHHVLAQHMKFVKLISTLPLSSLNYRTTTTR
jgi:hypothetical protein